MTALTYQEWEALVRFLHPTAQFTEETGDGYTYGEIGEVTAHTGPDMQADVVGCWCPPCLDCTPPSPNGYCWVERVTHDVFGDEEYEHVEFECKIL